MVNADAQKGVVMVSGGFVILLHSSRIYSRPQFFHNGTHTKRLLSNPPFQKTQAENGGVSGVGAKKVLI